MFRTKMNLTAAVGLLLAAVLACNFSTAKLSSIKVGKDKAVNTEASTFEGSDPVYVVATVSNAPGKVKVKGRLLIEDVPGQEAGPVPGLAKTLELDGSGTATYSFTPPPNGWPKGKYKIEVTLMDDSGAQKDQKTSSITVP